jgi:hypothetical protein
MRVTAAWKEWASDLSAQRLRDLKDAIETHHSVTGSLTDPDQMLLKLLTQEIETRYGK